MRRQERPAGAVAPARMPRRSVLALPFAAAVAAALAELGCGPGRERPPGAPDGRAAAPPRGDPSWSSAAPSSRAPGGGGGAGARAHGDAVQPRQDQPAPLPRRGEVHGDREGELAALRGRRWDAVIDTSGQLPRHVRASATALRDAAHLYLFVSSISAYRSVTGPGADEGAPGHPGRPRRRALDARELRRPQGAPASERPRRRCPGAWRWCGPASSSGRETRRIASRTGPSASLGEVRCSRPARRATPSRSSTCAISGRGSSTSPRAARRASSTRWGPTNRCPWAGSSTPAPPRPAATPSAPGSTPGSSSRATSRPWSDMPVLGPAGRGGRGDGRSSATRGRRGPGSPSGPVVDTARDTLAWFRTLPADRPGQAARGAHARAGSGGARRVARPVKRAGGSAPSVPSGSRRASRGWRPGRGACSSRRAPISSR